uniref:Uncharacterized protein n=1 Tax=Pithovirus LCPAC304 TaxID=2506594 RepID=A0A481Z945_9VIRU|nr:MAG: hypothetical protein LCPAC304_03580 [Pithovirus LCPAC304]
METEDIVTGLTHAIDQSPHKALICGGLSLFVDFLEGKTVDFEKLKEPIQTSTKIIAEDLEEQLLQTSDDTKEGLVIHRCFGKCMKRELLNVIGESLTEEEKKQLKEDKKYLIERLVENI